MKKKIYSLIVIFLIIIFVGTYSITFFKVDNKRMNSCFFQDDVVLFNNLSSGINIPFSNLKLFDYYNVDRQDIIIFYYPKMYDVSIRWKIKMISRCIGLPGDTIQLISGNLFIDGKAVSESTTIQHKYRMVSKTQDLDESFFTKYNITDYEKVHQEGIYDVIISSELVEKISKDDKISGLRPLKEKRDFNSPLIFPANPYYGFTSKDFGPVVNPYKGWNVSINYRNIGLYSTLIEQFEGKTVVVKDSKVFIDSKEINNYTFTKNYYFVLDDNRDQADDSRHWGFLPEDHILGVEIGSL